MKPQIYEAATELGDKIRMRVYPRDRNVQDPNREPQRRRSHRKSTQEIQQDDAARELREAHRRRGQSDHPRSESHKRIWKQVVDVLVPKTLESRRVQRIQSRQSDGRRGVRVRITVRTSSASMTYEGQAGAAKEQSMSESPSRAFRADTSHQDPQLSCSSQNSPCLRFDPAQTTEIQRTPTCLP